MVKQNFYIPDKEYTFRWEKANELMIQENLEALILYADDRLTFGPAHARWFADFQPHFEPVIILFVRNAEPMLLCGPETVGYALHTSRIRKILALKEFTHPNEDYVSIDIKGIKEILFDAMGSERPVNIGIAGKDLMGASLYENLKNALPNTQFKDVDYLVTLLRAHKTPHEIMIIREAYRIAEVGILAGIQQIRPGISENDLAIEMEYVMKKEGAEGLGIDNAVASGVYSQNILARPTLKKLKEGDAVILTVTPRFMGYHGAIARTVMLGKLDSEAKNSIEAGIAAHERSAAELRNGVLGKEVEGIGRRWMEEQGYGDYFLYSGIHSVGVIEFEAPIFGPTSTEILEKDMVISIDIPLFEAPFQGSRTENGYIITEDGAIPLSDIPNNIIN